jgi:serine protease Do
MDNGTVLDAEVLGTDSRTDIALLKVEGDDFTYVRLADAQPRIGEWVLAIGNPFGLGGSVTAGIVSQQGRDIQPGPYDEFIQIDAAINRGNSGGPTFNMRGRSDRRQHRHLLAIRWQCRHRLCCAVTIVTGRGR